MDSVFVFVMLALGSLLLGLLLVLLKLLGNNPQEVPF